MKLTIAYNKEKNGIELMFVPKLSDKTLENYLIDLGFKKSNSTGGMWYVTDRPSYNNYVKKLQEAFRNEIDPKTIKVAPSYDVDRNHIDHYQFSLVNIKTDDDKDEDKGIDYVIFDDLKKTASDIATRFAKAKYGSRLNSVSVSPRNFKRRARNAFDEGRIITGISENKEVQGIVVKPLKDASGFPNPELLTNEDGIYTEESAGDRYEIIEIPFSDEAKYKATIRLVRDENKKFPFTVDLERSIGVHHSISGGGISQLNYKHNFKNDAITEALTFLINNIQEGLGESYKSTSALKETRKALKVALKNIGEFAEKQSIFLISEQSKNIIKDLDKENLLIDYPELQSKKLDNDALSTIVEQLIEKFADLEDVSEIKETEDLIIGTRLFLEEALTHSNEESFIRDLKEIINRLESAEEPLPLEPEHIKNDYIENINKLARLLRVKPLVNHSTSLTNAEGVYTKKTAKDRYEVLFIPFTKSINFEASIRLVQNEQDQYLYGLSVTNTLSGWSGYSFLPSKVDTTYSSKEEALEAAILQVLDGVQYEHTEAVCIGGSEALKRAYRNTILALYDFADSVGIKLPDEKSKAILPLSIDGEESIEKEKAKKKTLNTLNEDVEKIVDELRELETDVDDKGVAFKIGNVKIELDEILKSTQGKQLINELKKLHSKLLEITYTIPKGKYRNRWFGISEKLGSRIGIEPFGNGKNFAFKIIQKHTTIDDELLAEFQSFIELHPNALHISYLKSKKDNSLSILKVRISSDRDTISFLHRRENNTIKIDGLNPLNEGIVSYNGGAVPIGKLKKAIKYMLANPKTLRIKPAEVYRLSDYKGAITTDVIHNGIDIPNVLLPEGVSNTLDFDNLKEQNSITLRQKLPRLFDITDGTLIYTIPSELFILSQFYYPKDKGISVGDKVLRSHWDLYGEHLFELLGYPIDSAYPYVNVNLGYYEVSTLEEIIGNKPKVWLLAIRDYRPIADLDQALQFINERIEVYQETLDESIKKDTSQKEGDDPNVYKNVIKKYEKHREKIQYYLDTYGNPYGTEKSNLETGIQETEIITPIVSNTNVVVSDITNGKTFTPNVLIPKGVIAPLDSGDFYIREAKKIQEIAPYLLEASDNNLSTLDAKTMFELSQMSHPNEFGLSVNRSPLLREWERRGESLFKELGYPTDLDYPYVNIHTGYRSVSPLGNLIDIERKGNQWWSVVEHNRPIADMQTALQFIDKEIEVLFNIRLSHTNIKTGKPLTKKESKEEYQSLSFKIERLEGSKIVIQHYLDLKKEDTSNNQDTIQEVLETVTTKEEAQDYFSNIIIPERIVAPFDKGHISPEEAEQLKEQFFYLFEYTYRNVHWASPVELFMLLQFTHLKESGISVKKETLYRIWQKEGQSLLNQLGYPTTSNYPYVNIEKGYLEIVPLEAIISKLPDVTIWWSAVKHYRPIANVSKALKDIAEKQNVLVKKFENYTGSKNKSDQTTSDSNEEFQNLSSDITLLRHSRNHLEAYSKSTQDTSKEITNSKDEPLATEDFLLIPVEEADRIRKDFKAKGFRVSFTGKEAFTRSLSTVELVGRSGYIQIHLNEKTEKEFNKWITILEKEVKKLEGKKDKKSKQSKEFRLDRISALKKETKELQALVEQEHKVFCDELFFGFIVRAKEYGYVFDGLDIADFRDYMMTNLFKGRIIENYPDQSIGKTARILIDDYFSSTTDKTAIESSSTADYLDKVVAIMHDHYMSNKRLTKKGVEALLTEADVANMGMLWEAGELSWLLWYKMIYTDPSPFVNRLQRMIHFWNKVQPTYAYSDSSKEQYKQYSTSCPISAMIAQYTQMSNASRIFEPSAGNGLLVLGADPAKTHVNEIDGSRRKSLEFQGFKTITQLNAAEPFPEEYTKSFDVVVTNPPFDKWSADKFDKGRMVKKYFDGNIGLNNHLRLEHLMSGLALHTMKDSGKAVLIIKGHIKFREDDGYMATYKPFFNWLYSRYVVDDVINMNAYKLYNKQGAVTEMMLILINGRKPKKSKKVAPNRDQEASLANIADSFQELWERIASHIKTPLEIEIEKLKIALGYDIF